MRRRVTSRYVKPVAPANPNILTGVEKVTKSVFYVGNVNMECSANAITDWCKDREVEVLNCSISESRTFGTAYAQLTVPATDEGKILSTGFWPATISHTVRKWRFADGTNVTERGGRLMQDIHTARNAHNHVDLVFFDLAKAFDTVWHRGLLTKLRTVYRIDGKAIGWLSSYISN